jgi:hypothetical protein
MQLLGVATFYPRDDSQRVENPSIDGCQLSSFDSQLLQSRRRHCTFPASMCMQFAWNQAPVIVLRFASTILHS